jgi:1-acyl-sn-glycerol-3-phosphate acyltransferase
MGFSYAVTLDSDGQHEPKDIPLFLQANQQHPGALILGSRNLDGVERSKGSSFANKFSNFWFYIQTGRNLPDTQTGYRLYPLKKLHGLCLLTSRYEAELELLVFASWHGVKLVPIQINVYYPPQELRVSHFRPGADFARISVLNTVLCFLAIVYGLPLRLYRFFANIFRTVYSLLFVLFFCFCVITPIVWLYVKIGKMTEKKRKKLHKIIFYSTRFVMLKHGIPGTRFIYKKSADVDFTKPSIIICNHQSHLDLACQLIFTPNIVFLTNQWVWNNPLYGLLIRNAEFYPVASGIEDLMPKLRSLVERGYSIAIYPEGTRSKNCRIGRFHQGAFYVAEQLGLDIIPMCLYGPGKILPKKTYHLQKGPIYIEINSPITQEELKGMGDTKAQASHMRKMYIERYEQIANKIEQDV